MENENRQDICESRAADYSYEQNKEVDSVREEQLREQQREKQKQAASIQKEGAKEFGIIGIASVIYASVFVVCLYKNFSGITSPIWAFATAYYMFYAAKAYDGAWTNFNKLISAVIVMLGSSNFITANTDIICMNYLAIFALIIVNVITIFFNTGKVNITNHILLMIQAVLGSIGEWDKTFLHMKFFARERKIKKNDKLIYILIGIVIAIPMLLIIAGILASADEVFNELFINVVKLISFDIFFDNIVGIVIMAIMGYVLPYAFIRNAKRRKIKVKEGKIANTEPIIAIIVTVAISGVYLLFSGIQIVYLFLGHGMLPADYSYAEYAREGFFQLLFVSAFNLMMVVVCIEFFRDSKILSVILTIVSGCTFVMIASSAYRMGIYISEYGLTFTRVLVLWALAVISLVMAGVLYQLYKREFNLFRYAVAVVSVCYIGLSFSHLDYFIAKYDLNFYEQMNSQEDAYDRWSEYVDYGYLLTLSDDAAPALMEHWPEISEYIDKKGTNVNHYDWAYQHDEKTGEEYNKITIRNFNISRYIAQECAK